MTMNTLIPPKRMVCNRKYVLVVAVALLGIITNACGGSGGSSSGKPAISFGSGSMAPPSSVTASGTAQFAASVSNDNAGLGVSWAVSCNSANVADCGSISRHTASGVPTTYIAPATVPPGGVVNVIANATADPNQSVSAVIQISPITYGPVSIAFSPAPPTSMSAGSTVPITAVVTNDHLDNNGNPMGYTLNVTCGSQAAGACGGFNGGGYTAPSVVPPGGTVSITATSRADTTKSTTANITIVPATVAIDLVQLPPASLAAGAPTSVSATVTGDPANLGVDWTIACSGTSCGSFIPTHTASRQSTSYAAPVVVPGGGTVTITATAKADPTKKASASITITARALRNDLLNGQYAFFLRGVDLSGATGLAGSLIADGNGNIVSGEEGLPKQSAVVSGISGTYFIGPDGLGTITLSGLPQSTWANGMQVFKVAVIDSSHLFMEEFDGTGTYNYEPGTNAWRITAFGATLSGTLELQKPSDFGSVPSGAYAFTWSALGPAAYFGGVLNASSSGTITRFVIDRFYGDVTDSIATSSGSQTFSLPDAFGHGTVSIGPYGFNYFMVDAGHIIVIGVSSLHVSGVPAGHLYAQASAPIIMTGSYAFTTAGSIPIYTNSVITGGAPQAAGGWLNCDSTGNLTGFLDSNNNGTVLSAPVNGASSPAGSCSTDSNGRAVFVLNGGGSSQFAVYPTLNHGLLMLQLDARKSGIGTAVRQLNPQAKIQGTYSTRARRLGLVDSARTRGNPPVGTGTGNWSNFSGLVTADGISNLSFKLDTDQINGRYIGKQGSFWTQTAAAPTTGAYTAGGTPSRFTGSISLPLLEIIPPQTGDVPFFFYVVDGSTVLYLEGDASPAVGEFRLQTF